MKLINTSRTRAAVLEETCRAPISRHLVLLPARAHTLRQEKGYIFFQILERELAWFSKSVEDKEL
jgi:hypothetical protein